VASSSALSACRFTDAKAVADTMARLKQGTDQLAAAVAAAQAAVAK
jgi:hypothetical protein